MTTSGKNVVNVMRLIYNEDLKNNLNVCPKCGNYFRLTAFERIELLIDEGTFIEEDMTLNSKMY